MIKHFLVFLESDIDFDLLPNRFQKVQSSLIKLKIYFS